MAQAPKYFAALIEVLTKRGVTLHTDGVRIWPIPKASLTPAEEKALTDHHAGFVALLAPPARAAAE